jgi:hypothetical protein
VLYENLSTDDFDKILASLPENPHDFHDPTIDWEEAGEAKH